MNRDSSTNGPAGFISPFNLKDKWALITGGAGLLGKEHARALLNIDAQVILWDSAVEKLSKVQIELQAEFPGKKVMVSKVDISSEIEVEKGFQELASSSIFVSILINNAAINPKYEKVDASGLESRVENFRLEDWNFQLSVGLTGAFICSKVFGSKMAENRNGVILNIASDLSIIAPDQRLYEQPELNENRQPVKPVTYSVIKTGLIGLTRYLATYWSADGVRVNALSPGGVYEGQDKEFVQRLTNLIPLGRMASASEYHSAVQFLCSDASAYMTGQNLVIDGGRSVW